MRCLLIPSYEIYSNSNAALCKAQAIQFIHVRVREGRVLKVEHPCPCFNLHTPSRVPLAAPRVVIN